MTDRELGGALPWWCRVISVCIAVAALAASVLACDKSPPLDKDLLSAQSCQQPGSFEVYPPGPDLLKQFKVKRSAWSKENRDFINMHEGMCWVLLSGECNALPDQPEAEQREVCAPWRDFVDFMVALGAPPLENCDVCLELGLWPKPAGWVPTLCGTKLTAETQQVSCNSLSVDYLRRLKHAPNLTSLWLKVSTVEDLAPLRDLRQLETLSIAWTRAKNLEPLRGLTKLKTLDVAYTKVRDLSPLEDLPALEELGIAETRVDSVQPLSRMQSLRSLVLDSTKVSDLTPIAELPLRRLELNYTEVRSLDACASMKELRSLSARRNELTTIEPLLGLEKLEKLDLLDNRITDYERLLELKSLRELRISGPGVTREVIERMQSQRPDMKISR